ncbi:MAG: M48 family metallopeptidase [Clostridia bacterium]|nr:M48 family metallopeptidase [Clostridia bacterium]
MTYSYELKRSKRKSISVEISREAKVIVRAPLKMSVKDVEAFLNSKSEWIDKHLSAMKEKLATMPRKLSEAEKNELKKNAKIIISKRVEYFAKIMGVDYNRISIKFQKTRFGSCSTKKNLNFNALVALMPSEILDYVIVHELSHLKEMNHSKQFWREVARVMPDYKSKRKWLKENGTKYMMLI